MDETSLGKMFDKESFIKIAAVFGIIFIAIGFYNAGYNNGYNYVKENKENYIAHNCICKEKVSILNNNKDIVETIEIKNKKIK